LNKKILHLVAGFGIYEYFVNCINSILKYDKSSDLLILITGNPKFFGWRNSSNFFDYQFEEILKVENFIKNLKFDNKIIVKRITTYSVGKTGSLYDAYNYALNFAKKNNYNYLNVIQNDMQLLFWNNNLIELIEELFEKNINTIQIHSGFPRKGSLPDFYKNSSNNIKKIYLDCIKRKKNIYYANTGIFDWGIINLSRAQNANLFFEKTESFMSAEYYKRGFVSLFCPVPYIGVIPWPATARKNKIVGKPHNLSNNDFLLKNVTEDLFYDLVSFDKELWQEDWVKPFGWYALNPCCYTDFKIKEYFVSLINYRKNKHNNFLRYISYNDEKSFLINLTSNNIRPRIFNLFFSYFYNNCLSLIKKFLNKEKVL
jgi:hypothetical protein